MKQIHNNWTGRPRIVLAIVAFGMVAASFAAGQTPAANSGANGTVGASGATGTTANTPGTNSNAPVGYVIATIIVKGNPDKIEVETVEVSDFMAMPNAITRPPGRFYLYLVNSTRQHPTSLALVSPDVPANPLAKLAATLNLDEFPKARRTATIFDGPPGTYQLKSTTTNQVFLTITIQPPGQAK